MMDPLSATHCGYEREMERRELPTFKFSFSAKYTSGAVLSL